MAAPKFGSKLLFTPGPLTTSETVKAAMLRDAGSRDAQFVSMVRSIRERLLAIGGAAPGEGFECVLMQGSGTFAIESVLSSAIPAHGRLLVLVNGAYGRRMAQIAGVHGIAVETLETAENRGIEAHAVGERLAGAGFTHVAVVHCETTSGIVNPVDRIGEVVARAGAAYIIDAMSSFGALPLLLDTAHADFVISSANKCLEGVPGFAFILARRSALLAAKGLARTLSLDLYAQWAGLETDGQFRFTPPTHALLAFDQALREWEAEGGVAGRAARYRRNHETLAAGMAALGIEAYLPPADRSFIITAYRYPPHPKFSFDLFYSRLSDLGFLIYPGKLTTEACFRIGTIGQLQSRDVEQLLAAIGKVLREMGVADSRAIAANQTALPAGQIVELVVLSAKLQTAHCGFLRGNGIVELRSRRHWAPGEILQVQLRKPWQDGERRLSGEIQASRIDAAALGLTPLRLTPCGEWNPVNEYWGAEGEPIGTWAKRIIKRGPRPAFEMEQVLPGYDYSDPELDPIGMAADMASAGDCESAQKVLMGLCRADLRCLDAHAHLGFLAFEDRPEEAKLHFEIGYRIGELSLGEGFDSVLLWGFIDNRPFLRCMHGFGLCLWRLRRFEEALRIFDRMLWLNPTDNQGVRLVIDDVRAKVAWENRREE